MRVYYIQCIDKMSKNGFINFPRQFICEFSGRKLILVSILTWKVKQGEGDMSKYS